MIHLQNSKDATKDSKVESLNISKYLYIPLLQHVGKSCDEVIIKIGDNVSKGQKLAQAHAKVYSPVHSSVSGKVIAIKKHFHPVIGVANTVIIENDFKDSTCFKQRAVSEIDSLTADSIRDIVFRSGIVGLGGASFPTHLKLNPPNKTDTLIINAAECEPFLTSDYRLMLEKTNEIIKGIELIERCLNVKKVFIGIEDNKPLAVKAFRAQKLKLNYKVAVLKSAYPQGGEKQLVKNIINKEIPRGKLPFDISVVVQNVATAFAIYEAVYFDKPLIERIVTVTGDCVKNPKNILAPIGAPIKDLIDFCGGFNTRPKRVIFGGPMMGIAQFDMDTPIIKSTNGVVFFSSIKEEEDSPVCIRCGNCVEYCPLGLMPCFIKLHADNQDWSMAKLYGCLDCMECGLCNYSCPQSINLVESVRIAKRRIPR